MANSVTFLAAYGGDGSTYTDDNDPNTGLGNGGHRVRLIPLFSNFIRVVAFVLAQVGVATAAAASAVNAPGTNGTTATNLTVVNGGNVNLNTQTGKNWVVGQSVSIASAAAAAATRMIGVITAYNSATGAMTVAVGAGIGVGNQFADGVIGLSADAATAAGLTSVTARVTALELTVQYDGEEGFTF